MEHRHQNTFHGMPLMEIAKRTGLSYVAVWRHAHDRRRVSAETALLYETRAGIPRQALRPDLWPPQPTNDKGDPTDDRHENNDTIPADLERIPF